MKSLKKTATKQDALRPAPASTYQPTQENVERIIAYVEQYLGVSFWELERLLAPHLPSVRGEYAIPSPADPNVLFWMGMSDEFSTTIQAAYATKRIHVEPTELLVYLVDGGMPNLPLLPKRRPAGGFTKVYWLPVCFHAGPSK